MTTKKAKKAPISALESKRTELAKENREALKFLHWPLPHGKKLHESEAKDRTAAAKIYNERARILTGFADVLFHAGTDCEAAVAMAGVTTAWPESIAGRSLEGAPAPMFDLELPNGRRLGDASVADLQEAILTYAEQSSNMARLMRELIALAHRFERGQF